MSHVDNVILSFSIMEDDDAMMSMIDPWTIEHASKQKFGPDLHATEYGGAKYLETPLRIAAFNFWPEQDFMAFLATLPWAEPENVQVIVKRQHEDRFVTLDLPGGE